MNEKYTSMQICKYTNMQVDNVDMKATKIIDIPLSTCILLLLGIGVQGESFIYSHIYIVQLRHIYA